MSPFRIWKYECLMRCQFRILMSEKTENRNNRKSATADISKEDCGCAVRIQSDLNYVEITRIFSDLRNRYELFAESFV